MFESRVLNVPTAAASACCHGVTRDGGFCPPCLGNAPVRRCCRASPTCHSTAPCVTIPHACIASPHPHAHTREKNMPHAPARCSHIPHTPHAPAATHLTHLQIPMLLIHLHLTHSLPPHTSRTYSSLSLLAPAKENDQHQHNQNLREMPSVFNEMPSVFNEMPSVFNEMPSVFNAFNACHMCI